VLVHALLAHAWNDPTQVLDLEAQLRGLLQRERKEHRLVRRAIELACVGLQQLAWAPTATDLHWSTYMWEHERDAVRWVEQGKEEVTPLAADVVLLSNMTYRLREEGADVSRVAARSDLPRCILNGFARRRIEDSGKVCNCDHKLCSVTNGSNASVPAAVVATRARFSENFCREQARLVARHGLPPWTSHGIDRHWKKQSLKKFWDQQAETVAEAGSPET
jgi:hypothetical protein